MSAIKDFKQQVDNSIAFIDESGENLENKAQKVKEFVEEKAMGWDELDSFIRNQLPPYLASTHLTKKVSTKAITAAGSPLVIIEDDDFKKGKFVRIYPCDEETKQNVLNYVKANQSYSLSGNQLIIVLINASYDENTAIDVNFNFIYRIYDKKNDSSFTAFIHRESINSEVINNE